MSQNTKSIQNPWIHSAAFDIFFLGFGWLVLLPFFIYYPQVHFRVLIPIVFIFNFAHRNLIYILVYGDPQQFNTRKYSYTILPLILIGIVAVASMWKTNGKGLMAHPLLLALTLVSFVWNFYHTLMQKIGFLRIYSRKVQNGKAWLDRTLIFSWFFVLVFLIPLHPQLKKQMLTLNSLGRLVIFTLEPYTSLFVVGLWIAIIFAVCITIFYFVDEYKSGIFNIAKIFFLLSVAALFGLFSYQFLTAYALFGFSHSLEYLAFVALFCHRKFGVKTAQKSIAKSIMSNQGIWLYLIYLGLGVTYILWNFWDSVSLARYYLATSFLHFIYDGWIWKIRKPEISQTLRLNANRIIQSTNS